MVLRPGCGRRPAQQLAEVSIWPLTCGNVGGAGVDSNHRPTDYESVWAQLADCANGRKRRSTCGFGYSSLTDAARRFATFCGLDAAWLSPPNPHGANLHRTRGGPERSRKSTRPWARIQEVHRRSRSPLTRRAAEARTPSDTGRRAAANASRCGLAPRLPVASPSAEACASESRSGWFSQRLDLCVRGSAPLAPPRPALACCGSDASEGGGREAEQSRRFEAQRRLYDQSLPERGLRYVPRDQSSVHVPSEQSGDEDVALASPSMR